MYSFVILFIFTTAVLVWYTHQLHYVNIKCEYSFFPWADSDENSRNKAELESIRSSPGQNLCKVWRSCKQTWGNCGVEVRMGRDNRGNHSRCWVAGSGGKISCYQQLHVCICDCSSNWLLLLCCPRRSVTSLYSSILTSVIGLPGICSYIWLLKYPWQVLRENSSVNVCLKYCSLLWLGTFIDS